MTKRSKTHNCEELIGSAARVAWAGMAKLVSRRWRRCRHWGWRKHVGIERMENPNNFAKILPDDFTNRVLPILQEVFDYPGSLFQLFNPRLSYRIISEHHLIMLDHTLLAALKTIGVSNGYNGCYYTFFEHDPQPPCELSLSSEIGSSDIGCWYIPFDKMDDARHIPYAFCRSFISPKGDWGIFITMEDFLMLGCTPEIGKKLQALVPEIDKSIYQFLEMYDEYERKLKVRWDWLPVLIHHLYGDGYDGLLEKYEFHST
jgi:hypothetical protein